MPARDGGAGLLDPSLALELLKDHECRPRRLVAP